MNKPIKILKRFKHNGIGVRRFQNWISDIKFKKGNGMDKSIIEIINENLHRGANGSKRFRNWLKDNNFYRKGKVLERYAYIRHDRIVKRYYPGLFQLLTLKSLSSRKVIEIGCGSGSASAAFAQVTKKLYGFDIDPMGVKVARKRAQCFGIENIEFEVTKGSEIIDRALERMESDTIILLYAVLEHMTEQERLDTLEKIWEKLGNDNLLIIGETPNRLCYFDEHSYLVPFVHLLPNYTFLKYAQKNDFRHAERFRDKKDDFDYNIERSRRGLGCSFHEFQMCFSDNLDECIVQSFNTPRTEEELFLIKVFNKYGIDVPVVFGTQMLHFAVQRMSDPVLRKNAKCNNERQRQEFLSRFL